MNNNSKNIVTKAEWLRKQKLRRRFAIICAILLAIIIVAVYIATYVYTGFGSFTISVKKNELTRYGISISEKPNSTVLNPILHAEALENADAIYSDEIKYVEEMHTTDGAHNGENYMAYTFYCINMGSQYDLTYSYSLVLKTSTNGIDEAIRFQLFVNDEDKGIFGKQEPDGSTPLYNYELNRQKDIYGQFIEEYDENGKQIYDRSESNQIKKFSSNTVTQGQIDHLLPGEYTKFTVVMWLEGTDPECDNDILEGTIRSEMIMTIIDAKELVED